MFTLLMQDSFTSEGIDKQIDLPGSADYFTARNLTQEATTHTPGRGIKFEWFNSSSFPPASQLRTFKTDATDVLNATQDTSGGFTYYASAPAVEAEVVGTAITNASPAVVAMVNTYSEGDVVRLYGATGMQQIAGMEFTISSVSGTGFTLLGLDASGFAAAATAVKARRVPKLKPVEPSALFVTAISQASEAVITLSKAHSFVVGQTLHFSIPSSFGMAEMDQKSATVTAVTAYSITVDVDSSAFSAFAFPLSTGVPVVRLFATVAPEGQRNSYNISEVPYRSGSFLPYMHLPAGQQSPAGSAGDIIFWQAWKKEN